MNERYATHVTAIIMQDILQLAMKMECSEFCAMTSAFQQDMCNGKASSAGVASKSRATSVFRRAWPFRSRETLKFSVPMRLFGGTPHLHGRFHQSYFVVHSLATMTWKCEERKREHHYLKLGPWMMPEQSGFFRGCTSGLVSWHTYMARYPAKHKRLHSRMEM
jgi:hypothetical protein